MLATESGGTINLGPMLRCCISLHQSTHKYYTYLNSVSARTYRNPVLPSEDGGPFGYRKGPVFSVTNCCRGSEGRGYEVLLSALGDSKSLYLLRIFFVIYIYFFLFLFLFWHSQSTKDLATRGLGEKGLLLKQTPGLSRD